MDLWATLALMLVFEGLFPALSPTLFRQTLIQMAQMDERALRISGLASMIFGAVALYWLTH